MRYSGPRMLARHPILALLHMLDLGKRPPSGRS
ncbi:MAG: nitrous oxide-stimulated promoter family protein [Deltaproteobacteria bacterium]|nr:nitrous oxide-stimulated promoter family protein [Deltaproteobacteria bacterium]